MLNTICIWNDDPPITVLRPRSHSWHRALWLDPPLFVGRCNLRFFFTTCDKLIFTFSSHFINTEHKEEKINSNFLPIKKKPYKNPSVISDIMCRKLENIISLWLSHLASPQRESYKTNSRTFRKRCPEYFALS